MNGGVEGQLPGEIWFHERRERWTAVFYREDGWKFLAENKWIAKKLKEISSLK
jgi:hypothetical protein